MNINEIVRLAYKGYMKKDVTVYTFSHKFEGKWFQVDADNETILMTGEHGDLAIGTNAIIAIEVTGGIYD